MEECPHLRAQNIGFSRNEIIVREGKGAKDRVTMLPESLKTKVSYTETIYPLGVSDADGHTVCNNKAYADSSAGVLCRDFAAQRCY